MVLDGHHLIINDNLIGIRRLWRRTVIAEPVINSLRSFTLEVLLGRMAMNKMKVFLTKKTTDRIIVIRDPLVYQLTTNELEVIFRLLHLEQVQLDRHCEKF